ncbi:TetR/AcrR family transcriptional regulator [Leptospira langatensis]|uniref:TetR/AcrR family transcriptional regulator n=2 Tax=Leptospira langatensis TaxID=2484983 RepID=A0A5F1ZSU3_9LEPT|nr:TetR/AcrR family transcriptional regulator [Leptospira langatensis]TGL41619.1 TetR/AcrR family transcriptional regulator [Leptospira langatensis]
MVTWMENHTLSETVSISSEPELTPDTDPAREDKEANHEKVHRKQDESKERIIRSAMKLFAERGFFETRIPEIAAHAKVGVGSLYRYFRNKDDIFNEAFRAAVLELSRFFDEASLKNSSPRERFFDFWQGLGIFSHRKLDQLILIERNLSSYLLDEESHKEANLLRKKISDYFAPFPGETNLKSVYPSIILGSFTGILRYQAISDKRLENAILKESAEMLWDGFSKLPKPDTNKKKQTKKS